MTSHQPSHHWEKYHGHLPHNAVHASDTYVVARANHQGQWIPGKLNVQDKSVYIPYDSKEVLVKSDIEVLVHAPGAEVLWVPASHGQVAEGSIGPMGQDGLFVGRVLCPYPENKYTPGKIHPAQKCLYLPYGGGEKKFDQYECLVIKSPSHHNQQPSHHHQQPVHIINQFSNDKVHVTVTSQTTSSTERFRWVPWQGSVPKHAVHAGDAYLVIRAFHANEWVPGKLNVTERKAYIPFDSKEVEVTQNIEVLTHLPGTEVAWIPASHGQVVQDAVGPLGRDGTFVGRVICPHPENTYTPGKIHPAHKCLYLPWDGKENKFENYEVCVIRSPQHHGHSNIENLVVNPQPGFGQPGFGQHGFGQPGFVQPGFNQPGFGQPGFGHPGSGQPGFGQPGFGQQNFAPHYVGQVHGGPNQVPFGQPNFGPGANFGAGPNFNANFGPGHH